VGDHVGIPAAVCFAYFFSLVLEILLLPWAMGITVLVRVVLQAVSLDYVTPLNNVDMLNLNHRQQYRDFTLTRQLEGLLQ
jgi:hypothetical protein